MYQISQKLQNMWDVVCLILRNHEWVDDCAEDWHSLHQINFCSFSLSARWIWTRSRTVTCTRPSSAPSSKRTWTAAMFEHLLWDCGPDYSSVRFLLSHGVKTHRADGSEMQEGHEPKRRESRSAFTQKLPQHTVNGSVISQDGLELCSITHHYCCASSITPR